MPRGGDIWGYITKKNSNILRIGFMNIGGFSLQKNKHKEERLRKNVTALEFDVFGMTELTTSWRLVNELASLYSRTRGWWEHLHICHSFNTSSPPVHQQQWGGTAIFSVNKAAHRVQKKGYDESNLGRWCWTQYKGQNSHTLHIVSAYRPNFPNGPLSVYTQHRTTLLERGDDRCPRVAFLEDLLQMLRASLQQGIHLILLTDGNSSMKNRDLQVALQGLDMQEACLT